MSWAPPVKRRKTSKLNVDENEVYVSPEGKHRHQCLHCDHVWEHSDQKAGDDQAHECPSCKKKQWAKYKGDKKPDTVDTSVSVVAGYSSYWGW